MKRRVPLVALLAALACSSQTIIPMGDSAEWFAEMPPSSQDYYVAGFRNGVYGASLFLTNVVEALPKDTPIRIRERLTLLARISDFLEEVDEDTLRYWITYPEKGGEWQENIILYLVKKASIPQKEAKEWLKRH